MTITWDRFRGRTTFILGADKNVGKTTFLNVALARLRESGCTPAYLTIGVDGERFDLISGAPKPDISAKEGDILVTTETAAERSDAQLSVAQVFPERTVLGRLLLAQVTRAGAIELIGPETHQQLSVILDAIQNNMEADAVLVDGAVNRVTQVAAARHPGFVYVVLTKKENMNRMVDQIKLISAMQSIPEAPANRPSNMDCLKGALTRVKLEPLLKQDNPLLIEDFTRIFLPRKDLMSLRKSRDIFFRTVFEMFFILVHLRDVDRRVFLEKIGPDKIVEKIVFDLPNE